MEFYTAVKKNEFINFADKWIKLENIMSNEVTQTKAICSLSSAVPTSKSSDVSIQHKDAGTGDERRVTGEMGKLGTKDFITEGEAIREQGQIAPR